MLIVKMFRYRLEPNREQRVTFARFAGCCRFIFNHGLAARKAHYELHGRTPTYVDQCRELTQMKKVEETAWLAEVHSMVLQQSLKDLDFAYKCFFRRLKSGKVSGFPRFKKKGQKDSFRYPADVKVEPQRVYLPKIGWVRYINSRPLEGKLLQTTVKRDGRHWFVSFVCKLDLPTPSQPESVVERAVGIDLGLKSYAVLSDGTEIENPKFLRRALRKLRREQRRLSRKKKGSANFQRQKRKLANVYLKVRQCRHDFCHKASTAVAKKYSLIAVEDLNIEGMTKNRHLSLSISDASWGKFTSMLKYKAEWAGKPFITIDRFLATSQLCSTCGGRKPMPLCLRTYQCGVCGAVLDRDLNASINIRDAGIAKLGSVGGLER